VQVVKEQFEYVAYDANSVTSYTPDDVPCKTETCPVVEGYKIGVVKPRIA
jgi:hypothetical protein